MDAHTLEDVLHQQGSAKYRFRFRFELLGPGSDKVVNIYDHGRDRFVTGSRPGRNGGREWSRPGREKFIQARLLGKLCSK